jgi:hypothetical protein
MLVSTLATVIAPAIALRDADGAQVIAPVDSVLLYVEASKELMFCRASMQPACQRASRRASNVFLAGFSPDHKMHRSLLWAPSCPIVLTLVSTIYQEFLAVSLRLNPSEKETVQRSICLSSKGVVFLR